MKYVPVILEEVAQKYCLPGEHIVHEYFVQTKRIRESVAAYRRSLYTDEYNDFSCDRLSSVEDARKWKNEFKKKFPGVKIKVRLMTDEQIYQESLACLKRI